MSRAHVFVRGIGSLRRACVIRNGDVRNSRRMNCRAGNLDPPDVRKLAKLAQIHVTDEEVKEWEPKLKEIVGWLDKLQEIDVDGIEPTSRMSFNSPSAAGEDIPRIFEDREALMDAAPSKEGPYVKVPKIM